MSAPDTVQQTIEAKLTRGLGPAHLEVINQSHMHSGPGTETHFKVVIVADAFADMRLVARHREVHTLLADELKAGVHALSIEALTPAQWEARGHAIRPSPPCLGGSKADA